MPAGGALGGLVHRLEQLDEQPAQLGAVLLAHQPQAVVTSTATSLASNVATVVGTLIAMVALNWQLALLSPIMIPPPVLVARLAGSGLEPAGPALEERLRAVLAVCAGPRQGDRGQVGGPLVRECTSYAHFLAGSWQ